MLLLFARFWTFYFGNIKKIILTKHVLFLISSCRILLHFVILLHLSEFSMIASCKESPMNPWPLFHYIMIVLDSVIYSAQWYSPSQVIYNFNYNLYNVVDL